MTGARSEGPYAGTAPVAVEEKPQSGARPRRVVWELTRACNLTCRHCRTVTCPAPTGKDLSTDQVVRVIEDIASVARPTFVFTGGEPLKRPDLFTIAAHASQHGAVVVLETNATMITAEAAAFLRTCGVAAVHVALDGATAETHEEFRDIPGAWAAAWRGIAHLKAVGLPFHLKFTIGVHNRDQVPAMLRLAEQEGAAGVHLCARMPAGCGIRLERDERLSPEEMEALLGWLSASFERTTVAVQATCAPQFHRVLRQQGGAAVVERQREQAHAVVGGGCSAATQGCFIAHDGQVQPCRHLPLPVGHVLQQRFQEIWEHALLLRQLRDRDLLGGKCGECGYRGACGGCRARAYEAYGFPLAQDPSCPYEPGD
ncbi:radical SAM/SPASM domain-containing protein [Symbiobacterium thermophilum]|nr:radical SAM protein [Symbiobacterium thermophilum]